MHSLFDHCNSFAFTLPARENNAALMSKELRIPGIKVSTKTLRKSIEKVIKEALALDYIMLTFLQPVTFYEIQTEIEEANYANNGEKHTSRNKDPFKNHPAGGQKRT